MAIDTGNRPLAGILWMFLTGLTFVGVTAIVRHLGTALPAAESAFIRFLYGIAFLIPAILPVLRSGLPAGAGRLILIRGALHTAAVILWFYAMAHIPMAEVTAIGYLNPVVVTAGGMLLFRERLTALRVAAILAALAGALVILRPGFRTVETGHLAQLGAALGFGLSYLIAKRLSALLPAGALVALLSVTVTAGLAPFALAVWVTPTPGQVLWLGGVAAFATAGHYTMARAFAAAPLTVTQPVIFLQLVWAVLTGYVLFGEVVDPLVIAGGGIIIAAILALTVKEARDRRQSDRAGAEAAQPL
jgi:drug/metabolite transporter (DMT)-like permease